MTVNAPGQLHLDRFPFFAVKDRSCKISHDCGFAAFAVRAGHACDNDFPYSVPNAITLTLGRQRLTVAVRPSMW
jgi:hypothetical protein